MKKSSAEDKLNLLDTFVLSGVLTILFTRAVLILTGFPQLGGDSLHIAHVLWGGLFLTVAFLILLFLDRPNKYLAALMGGIGFGLFIDESGKFITSDNNYFYQPALTLIYLMFVGIWFISRLLILRNSQQKFLSPAEWPKSSFAMKLIVFWVIAQFGVGAVMFILTLITGFGDTNEIIGITGLGLGASIIYALILGLGLRRMRQNRLLDAAHLIRGGTLFAILLMYPFVMFSYPEFAVIGLLITVPVTVALSEVSLQDLIDNLRVYKSINR